MNFESVDDLIAAVGYAHLTPRKILNRLYAVLHPNEAPRPRPRPPASRRARKRRPQDRGRGHFRRGRRVDAFRQVL